MSGVLYASSGLPGTRIRASHIVLEALFLLSVGLLARSLKLEYFQLSCFS